MRFRSWAATDKGAVRKHNEDNLVNRPEIGVWAVADGAGGHQAGEVASALIAEVLNAIPPGMSAAQLLSEVRLRVEDAHNRLCAEAASRGPHTTIASTVVILVAKDEHFACLWAGDSRAYLLRDDEFRQITRDHSLVQELVDAGMVRAEDAEAHPQSNVITRAVGVDGEPFVMDKVSGRLMEGDRFLLCSDGVSKTLPEAALAALMASSTGIPAPDAIIAAALARQVNDNVTAVVVDILPG